MKPNFFKKSLSYKFISNNFNMDLSPSVIGYEICNRYKPTIYLDKDCYILHFVIKGRGTVNYGEQPIVISADHCFLIEPNQAVSYQPDYDNPWSYVWIEIGGEIAKKIISRINFHGQGMVLKIIHPQHIYDVFSAIFDDGQVEMNQAAELLRVNSHVQRIFSLLVKEHCIDEAQIGTSKKENQIKRIREYLDLNYADPHISIEKVAQHFYFNPSYMSRAFKEQIGIGPRKYLIQLRMRRAVELLKNKSYSISQIANSLGYINQFYFSKEFFDYYGVRPTKYSEET